MNEEWHRRHPLARHATLLQRAAWHEAHADACGCREIPPSIKAVLASQRRK
jgi:hypothetical protein